MQEVLRIFHNTVAEPNIVYDESGEKIIHSTPAILESIEFVPGHEPVIVEKPNMNRRVSTAHKQQAATIVQPVLPPIDEATGLPMKMMKVPAAWTPKNRRANAAFIYIFFRNVRTFSRFPLNF